MPNKLAGYRKMYGIQQKDIAKIIGIPVQTYCNKERNQKAEFRRSEMIKLTHFFKKLNPSLTMDELFFNQ